MAFSFDGATANLTLSAALFTAVPFTMAGMFKRPSVGAVTSFLAMYDNVTEANTFRMNSPASNIIQGVTTAATVNGVGATTETCVVNKWFGAAMISGAANSRYAAHNGRFGAQETTNLTPTGLASFVIGGRGLGVQFLLGLAAEIAVWLAALTPSETAAHANGVPAYKIRPESLLLYMPLRIKTGIRDFGPRQLVFTNTAAVPVSDHPPMENSYGY